MERKHISIVIPTYNIKDLILNCVRSTVANTRYPDWHLYIVDDGSTDGSFDALAIEFKFLIPEKITLLRNFENEGFIKAWNKGVRKALEEFGGTNGQHIALLESDTIVHPGWLCVLNDIIETQEKVGFVTYKGLVGDYYGPGIAEAKVAIPMICCLINGKLIEEIGLLEERLFFVYADTLFCRKTLRADWKILISPKDLADHIAKGEKYKEYEASAISSLYRAIDEKDLVVFKQIIKEDPSLNG